MTYFIKNGIKQLSLRLYRLYKRTGQIIVTWYYYMSSISLESFIYSDLISLWAGLTIMWIAFWRVDWINLPPFVRNILCWIIFPCLTPLLCHWSLYACMSYSNIQLKEMSVRWKMLKLLKWQSKENHRLTDSTFKFFSVKEQNLTC